MKLCEFLCGLEATVIDKTIGMSLEEARIKKGEIVILKIKKEPNSLLKNNGKYPVVIMASRKHGDLGLYRFRLRDLKM